MDDARDGAALHPPSGRFRAPWGMAGMLALVLAIEATLAGHDHRFAEVWHWDWRTFGKAVTVKSKGRDVLIFGDSLVKFGLMPKIIRDRSGLTAFNFAIHSGQTPASYFMLRRALEAGARPRAVLLDLNAHMLRLPPDDKSSLWGDLLRPGEAFHLAWTMDRDFAFLAKTMTSCYLPTFRERFEIRQNLMAAFRGEDSSTRRSEYIRGIRQNWKVNQGAELLQDSPPPTSDWAGWAAVHYPQWVPNPVNVVYLERFLALARSYQVPVIWYLPPIHPEVQVHTEASGFDAGYTRFVEDVRARFPGTLVVDARKAGFAAELFSDGAHLNKRGALRLSAAMGDLLRHRDEAMARGWVALDPSSSRPFEGPIEDISQSIAKVQAAESASVRR